MQHKEYNGYHNYETWCVALWIDNDQGLAEARWELVREHEASPFNLAIHLHSWTHKTLIPDLGSCLAQDLLLASMSEVNWTELAETWIEDLETVTP